MFRHRAVSTFVIFSTKTLIIIIESHTLFLWHCCCRFPSEYLILVYCLILLFVRRVSKIVHYLFFYNFNKYEPIFVIFGKRYPAICQGNGNDVISHVAALLISMSFNERDPTMLVKILYLSKHNTAQKVLKEFQVRVGTSNPKSSEAAKNLYLAFREWQTMNCA